MRPMPAGYRLRSLKVDDVEALIAAERRSTELLAATGWPQLLDGSFARADFDALIAGGETIVAADADDRPVGLSVACDVANAWYLCELFVDPPHGRQGIGAALLEATVDRARFGFYSAVALSTFHAVPFNRPFYEKHRFIAHDYRVAPESMRARFLRDIPAGVPSDARVLMIRRL